MRVLLVGNYASDGQHSMLSFPSALKAGLADHDVTAEISSAKARFGGRGRRGDKWAAYIDKYVVYPRELRRLAAEYDVVHVCDQGNALYVRSLGERSHLVTCHDLLAVRSALGELPYWRTGPTGKVYQRLNRKALGRARMVAAVSDATLADCRRLLGLPESRLRLVWNGMYKAFEPLGSSAAEALLERERVPLGGPFLLHVGGNQPYKNRSGAVDLFRELRRKAPDRGLRLVLAGEPHPAELLEDGVVGVANPSDAVLAALYSRADALLVTSFDEGFSLPIIEAQSCQCPVIVNDKPPMRTVAGVGALKVDVSNLDEAATVILASFDALGDQRASGLENAAQYSFGKMAAAYADLYRELA